MRAATVGLRAGMFGSTGARTYSKFIVECLASITPMVHYGEK
jgi:hypothetical protein